MVFGAAGLQFAYAYRLIMGVGFANSLMEGGIFAFGAGVNRARPRRLAWRC